MNNMEEQSLANLHSRENLQIWLVRLEGCPPVGSVVVGGSREFFNSESFSDAKCPFLIVMGLRSLFYFILIFFPHLVPQRKTTPVPSSIPVAGRGWGWVEKDWACPTGDKGGFPGNVAAQRNMQCSSVPVCRSSVCPCWRLLALCVAFPVLLYQHVLASWELQHRWGKSSGLV